MDTVKQKPGTNKKAPISPELRLHISRICVVLCLAVTTAFCGFGAYYQSYGYESQLQKDNFRSLAAQFQFQVMENLNTKVLSLASMANVVSLSCPLVENWPNCSVPYDPFQNITAPIISITNMRALSFGVVLTSEQVDGFEAFAYDFFDREGYPGIGINSFGKGIWALNETAKTKYHSTEPYADGQYDILLPLLEVGNLAANRPSVMYNLYSEKKRVQNIDHMLNCFYARNRTATECSAITDVIFLVQDVTFSPAVLVMHPVTPLHNNSVVTGLVQSVFNWDTVFSHALPEYVSDLDVVLCGGQDKYTFRVSNGVAAYSELGDKHDRSYTAQGRAFPVSIFAGSVQYYVEIYPTQVYVNSFHTKTPLYAMIVTVSIVLFTSVVFVLYDLLLNRSAVEKELRVNINTKRLFVRFISHEIRTPLNTVHIGLKLLVSEMLQYVSALRNGIDAQPPGAADKIKDWVGVIRDIEDSSDSAIVVLNDLINYDKISMGTLNPEFEVVSLWDLVCATVKPFHVQARRGGIALKVLLECEQEDLAAERSAKLDRLVVIADRVKVGQVIRNLLSNALKFSKEGSAVVIRVRWDENGLPAARLPAGFVSNKDKSNATLPTAFSSNTVTPESARPLTLARAGSLVVTVTDSGAGISKDNQLHLFREGVQFHANQLQAGQGSGLGLWISHGIILLHSGVLSATSEGEGLGSEFRCELPAALNPTKVPRALTSVHTPRDSDHTGSASLRQVSRKPSRSAPSLSMTSPMHSGLERQDSVRNVMVVDDSGPTRKVVARLLRNAGYVCTEAVDGQDCLDQILAMGENPVHLILMDFEMPRMNGPTATAKLRELDYTMPIIGVTGNVLSADKDFFIAHGANSVLHKPLSIEQLKAEVSKINSKQGDSSGANFLSPSGSDQRGTNKSGEFGVEMV